MTVIPKRLLRIQAGQKDSYLEWDENFDISAKITKTIDKKPNKAEIKIYNLTVQSYNFLTIPGITIQVTAGENVAGSLFFGNVLKEGTKTIDKMPGRETTIMAVEGKVAYQDNSGYYGSYPPNTTRSQILTDLLKEYAIGLGYIDPSIPEKTYTGPVNIFGPVREVLDALYYGYFWSIENNVINIHTVNKKRTENTLIVDGYNMLGKPSYTNVGAEITTYFWNEAECGKGLLLNIKEKVQLFRIEKVQHLISTDAQSKWQTKLTGKLIEDENTSYRGMPIQEGPTLP